MAKSTGLAVIVVVACFARYGSPEVNDWDSLRYRTILGDGSSFLVWDVAEERLLFELRLPSDSWLIGFGFSDWGDTTNADFLMTWVDQFNRIHFQDTWIDSFGRIIADANQDFHYESVQKFGNTTRLRFWRDVNTCDPYDYKIDTGTTHVLLFTEARRPSSLADISVEVLDVKLTRVQLIKSSVKVSEQDATWKYFDIRAPSVLVPPEETTYWCSVMRLPLLFQKHHIVKFAGVIDHASQGIVHHMEAFHCEISPRDVPPAYNGPCSSEEKPAELNSCSKVIGAWAMGAVEFIYPPEAGVPIGGRGSSRYVMLEVHYNNVAKRSGVIDSSGIRFTYTPILREHDAAVMEVGVIYDSRLSIPPQQKSFRLEGACSSECTEQSLPQNGIKVFASQLHTHATGRKVRTIHIRDGVRLRDLNADEHYSHHFQEIRLLPKPVTVLPGDALINVCEHDTTSRIDVTLGGFAISEEMCVNYMHYYPKSSLEVCKSSIATSALERFFSMMAYYMGDSTSALNTVSQNLKLISWNPISSKLLQWFYDTMSIEQACLKPDGSAHTGRWKELSKPSPWFSTEYDDECGVQEDPANNRSSAAAS